MPRRALLAALSLPNAGRTQPMPPFGGAVFAHAVVAAERLSGGRFGVAVLDTENGQAFAHRGAERFAFCSTFKCILAAATLDAVDLGRERLDRAIPVTPGDLVPHAPVTGQHVGGTLTVQALCEAMMSWSDNPAANLLLRALGGPAALTEFARGLGDAEFRLDRIETALNEAAPGDPRDTTTPAAMLATLQRLLVGDALAPASREILAGWLIGCRTGDRKIRAGLPADWRCGDRTGSGERGTTNDIAILWPPRRRPLLVVGFITESATALEQRDAALAALGRGVAAALA
nr:class A beta-lactamase [Plastoroseomonas arctica]